jgi:PQQ-dependent dehydrogenase (methanol/ethanol family)
MIDRKSPCDNKEPRHRPNTKSALIQGSVMLALLLTASGFQAEAASTGAAAGGQWKTAGGTAQGTRFSALKDINTTNVKQLKEEFALKTPVKGRFMGEPLVVGNMLYVVTPFPNRLIAYDLSNRGKIKWTYSSGIDRYAKGANCCGGINRGAAYADGKIVFNLLDNTVVAVDAVTGKQVWRRNLADPHTGVTMTVAPIIVKGKVITASSSGEMGVRGWIQALDLKTGTPLWRAYNTGPDADVLIDQKFRDNSIYYKGQKDLGATTWPNKRGWLLGGSAAWAYLTYDPELDLLFYGTSQPGVWNADMRKGDNKWGASIFARKPDTGTAVWAYQFTPHDSWDYDAGSENIAVNQTVTVNGINHNKLLVHFNKNGFAYVFDRMTGEVLKAPQFGAEVNWASKIALTTDPKTGLPSALPVVNENMRVHQGKVTENICPSVLGAKGWEPGAFSPDTNLFYMPTFNLCSNLEALKTEFISGAPYMGTDYSIKPGKDMTYVSELIAWDATATDPKLHKKWGVKEPAMIYAGVLSTRGGLVFYTTQAQDFLKLPPALKALDAQNGKPLWNVTLQCNTVGNPISFQGPDKKQRIAVFSDDACTGKKVTSGGTVHVYKLP